MFKLEENGRQIGQYLSKLIDRKYKSKRQFCKAYIEADDNREADNEVIQKMANRISQIIQGKKAIQTIVLLLPKIKLYGKDMCIEKINLF